MFKFVKDYKGEVNNEPSLTKQGQAVSVKDMLERFGYRNPLSDDYEFDSRIDGSDIEASDFDGDLDDELIDVSEAIHNINDKLNQHQQTNDKKSEKEGSADKVSEQTKAAESEPALDK